MAAVTSAINCSRNSSVTMAISVTARLSVRASIFTFSIYPEPIGMSWDAHKPVSWRGQDTGSQQTLPPQDDFSQPLYWPGDPISGPIVTAVTLASRPEHQW